MGKNLQIVDFGGGNLNAAKLELLKRTVASDCNATEFDLFCEVARSLGLDPFRRQVIPLVFSKNNPDKRKMTIVVAIDGMRRIAARCGDYRPADAAPKIDYDETTKDEMNPQGIVRAEVCVYKQDRVTGEWHGCIGEAYWDEFRPEEIKWGQERGVVDGKKLPDNWARMPRLMIAKCAESQALRRGWPDDLSSVYSDDEMAQAQLAETASEAMERSKLEKRAAAVNRNGILLQLEPQGDIKSFKVGEAGDALIQALQGCGLSQQVKWLIATNREALNHLWAEDEGAALAVKRCGEQRIEALQEAEHEEAGDA
jgi:phage recombination protein Bet